MQDQVRYLKSMAIKAEFIGDEQESKEAKQQLERGECQIVYGSPETFLKMVGNAQQGCLQKEVVFGCSW